MTPTERIARSLPKRSDTHLSAARIAYRLATLDSKIPPSNRRRWVERAALAVEAAPND